MAGNSVGKQEQGFILVYESGIAPGQLPHSFIT